MGVGFGVLWGGFRGWQGWVWGGGEWQRWVVVSGRGGFGWLAGVGLGGWQGWVCFTLLQTHHVEYFLEHFPRVQTNTGKINILL